MLESIKAILIVLAIIVVILGFSGIMAMIQIDYIDPWRKRRKVRKRLAGKHIVEISAEKARLVSNFQMYDEGMTEHRFRGEVFHWLVANTTGTSGCVPSEGFGDHDKPRSYYFERVDDAMFFKIVWG